MKVLDLLGFRKQAGAIGARIGELRQTINDLAIQRESIAKSPVTKAEVKDALKAWLAKMGADYRASMAGHFARMAAGDTNFTLRNATGWTGLNSEQFLELTFCGLLGTVAHDSLCKAIDEMPWPEGAISATDRASSLAAIDKKLSALVEEEQELIAATQAAVSDASTAQDLRGASAVERGRLLKAVDEQAATAPEIASADADSGSERTPNPLHAQMGIAKAVNEAPEGGTRRPVALRGGA